MIGRIDIRANAAHPNFPLPPVYMFAGAPSSPRVFGVPCRVGSWAITAVSVAVAYPDNATRTVPLTQVDGTWIGVIPACATTGAVQNGVQIVADGTDENGNAVTGYCLGVGDLFVMERDFTATAAGTRYYFHYCEEAPATPQVGDAVYADGSLKWWDGTAWRDFGGSSITIDPALSPTSENPVQNKVVKGALDAKLDGAAAYPAWNDSSFHGWWPSGTVVSWKGKLYRTEEGTAAPSEPGTPEGADDWTEITIQLLLAAKANSAGVNAALAQKANSADVATALAQKASFADLSYALVTPGEWEFAPYPDGVTSVEFYGYDSGDGWGISVNGDAPVYAGLNEPNAMELEWDVLVDGTSCIITATRASLPGHLCDRAVNAVSVSTDTELTLPELVNAGKARDFLVRLAISGSTVPTITFAAPTGESIVYETDGDEFPVPDAEGNWLYSFTETAAHTFAVALKKVNEVAAPQTQGGS